MKRPVISMTNSSFTNVGTVFRLPEGFRGRLEGSNNVFSRVGTVVEMRDDKGSQIAVPPEMLDLVRRQYQEALRLTGDHERAIGQVSEDSRIKSFLREKGIESASLVTAVGQLIAQLFGGT